MFDLSALDAELDGLGRAPENATSLARTFADITLSGDLSAQLAQVDAELSLIADTSMLASMPTDGDALSGIVRIEPGPREQAPQAHTETQGFAPLSEITEVEIAPEPASLHDAFDTYRERAYGEPPSSESRAHSEPPAYGPAAHSEPPLASEPPAAARAASLTQSQEIVLPDPIAREELSHESGELELSGDDPSSGSFELPGAPTEPRIAPEHEAAVRTASLLPFDDVQDALEGSQPIAIGSARATLDLGTDFDRDPDAEFDALLSEATDPRGIPTLGASSEFDTDDLLRGLEGDEPLEDALAHGAGEEDAPHEAEALTRSLYEDEDDDEDAGEQTDVLDRATLGAIQSKVHGSASAEGDDDEEIALSPDELDSGELELLADDQPTMATQHVPTTDAPAPPPAKSAPARPGLSNKAPPPPPPSSNPERRPSGFLGRLFTKRESE